MLIRSASPSLDSTHPRLRSKHSPFDVCGVCGHDRARSSVQQAAPPQNNQGQTHTVCHVKIEADEMEYLTQSRNPTGSILSQSYYSVYYIYIGTTALKSHPR